MTIHSVVIQKLLSTNAHIGRRISSEQFKVFTYGVRNGVTIIDSEKTLICLRAACRFMGLLAQQKAQFMFVNTNPLYDEIFQQMSKKIGYKYNNFWRVPGYLTNSLNPRRFKSGKKKFCFSPGKLPDCLIVVDAERKSSIINEAAKLRIPVVALVDPRMPLDIFNKITYPIPANDSVQFVYLFCNLITKTFLLEQKQPMISQKTKSEDERLQGKADDANKEVLVVPYQNLTYFSFDSSETKKILDKLLVLKINDSLGTKMGFSSSKSTFEVCNGVTSLDLFINQMKSLNSKYGCKVPLFVMTTVQTHNDTLKIVDKHSKENVDIHVVCKTQNFLANGIEGQSNENELYQPDHVRVLLSLMSSERFDMSFMQGKEYFLVASGDNMAAAADPKILNHLIKNKIQCCMEVVPPSLHKFKDGASSSQGKIQLLEISLFAANHSMEKFKFIDTNNLWMSLDALKYLIDVYTVGMGDETIPVLKNDNKAFLRETAAGSALRFFSDAVGVNVPQNRFFPLESTSDLLLARSDLYRFTDGLLVRNKARKDPLDPDIKLGPEFSQVKEFVSRFRSIPNIIELESLEVTGDVWFGTGTTLKGRVTIAAKAHVRLEIPDGAVIENKVIDRPGLLP